MGPEQLEPRLGAPQTAGRAAPRDRRKSPSLRAGGLGVALMAGWLVVIMVASLVLAGSQHSSRHAIRGRLQARTKYAASFISVYAHDLLARERSAAQSWLAAPHVSNDALARAASGLELRGAVLLNGAGRPIAAFAGSSVIALPLDLSGGGASVPSHIWLEQPGGSPVIGFAVRYAAATGPRVLVGAFTTTGTVVPTALGNVLATPGWRADLLDPNGSRLTAGRPGGGQGPRVDSGAAVAGTPWRLAVSASQSELYGMLNGPDRWMAWAALAGLAVAGLVLIVLVARLARHRTRLTEVNTELSRLAAVDPLTGLRNRRAIEQYLHDALSAARRHDMALSLLVVDIDHFKTINDRLGHRVGDAVLAHTARVLDRAMRAEDAVGRWGGEEFLVVLPGTDEAGAVHATERLREALAADQPEVVLAHGLPVTMTIGVAEWHDEEMSELVSRADSALYGGKAAGRDTARVSPGAGVVGAGEPA